MTDKQVIIDYKNLCDYYSREVGCYATFDGRCTKEQCSTYKLLQKLQSKEQECEELKEKINSLICSANCYKYKQAEKYKQTLTEIKEFIENEMIPNGDTYIILQKISEVENV